MSDISNRQKATIDLPCVFRFIEARPADIDGDPIASRAPSISGINRTRVMAATRLYEARLAMHAKIRQSHLPALSKTRLQKQFDGLSHFTEADVDTAIRNEREYLYQLFQSSVV